MSQALAKPLNVARAAKAIALIGTILALVPGVAAAQPRDETVQVCNACHGENGVPLEKTIPVIWGQQQGYLYLQLRDYKRGDRKNEPMQAVVADMERSDMMA